MIRIKSSSFYLFAAIIVLASCHPKISTGEIHDQTPQLAFPGAEGFGKYTSGGRGGEVIIVFEPE